MTVSWMVYFCSTYNDEETGEISFIVGYFSLLFTAKNTVDESKIQYFHVILKALMTVLH